jgi:two-component system phosphate regulon response regulator PhoB
MNGKNVLLIEDEADLGEVICFHLDREGFKPIFVSSAEEGLEKLKSNSIELIILDLMLPGMDGFEFLRVIQRTSHAMIPVMISSAKSDVVDIVSGLEVGAVDYMPKPYHPKVLVAKVRSIIRRNLISHGLQNKSVQEEEESKKFSGLSIDVEKYEAKIFDKKLSLTNTEFKILQFLFNNKGRVFSRYQIVDNVHGSNYSVTDRSIDVQILSLRKKLGKFSGLIETVRGVGYKFTESSSHKDASDDGISV